MPHTFVLSGVGLLAQGDADLAQQINLGSTPYWVLAGYLLLLLILGIAGWLKSKEGEEDYYLAGRNQGWLVSSLTIMATFFSSFALLGAPGMVYREGVVFALFSLNVPVAGLCVYLIGARIWRVGRRFGYVTPGDMAADYYGGSSGAALRVLVAITGILYAIPYVVMQIQAGGVITQAMFGEDAFTIGALLLAAITMIYIMIGGMRSVAWTDLIQGILLIGGMLVGGLAMFLVFDGPANFGQRVTSELPPSSLTAPGNTGAWRWTLVFTVCVLGSTGSMVQPAQWMRYYSARNELTLQRGAVIFAAVLTTCFILGVMLIGLAGQILYPLQQGRKVTVPEGPAKLEQPLPEVSRGQLRYLPPKAAGGAGQLIHSWNLREGDAKLSPEELERLQAAPGVGSVASDLNQQPSELMPHPKVDPDPVDGKLYDRILVVVLNEQLPRVLGQFGALFASLMIVAIMAASMSTADSNLHAMSALLTRDLYDQYIRPGAKEAERVWVGRGVIVGATVLALLIVFLGRLPAVASRFDFLSMIATMGLMAIAFSAQLLPLVIDMIYLRKGTGAGAAAGLAGGLLAAFLFGPLFAVTVTALGKPVPLVMLSDLVSSIKGMLSDGQNTYAVHGSLWGLIVNVGLFAVVSQFTRPPSAERREAFERELSG